MAVRVFQPTDLIAIHPQFNMPIDEFVQNLCNIPYQPLLEVFTSVGR